MRFSKKAFQEWLESKTNLTRVGRPEHVFKCPLCEFLKAQGAKSVYMTFDFRTVDKVHTENPMWARKFQHAACDFIEIDDGRRQITAKRALSFL